MLDPVQARLIPRRFRDPLTARLPRLSGIPLCLSSLFVSFVLSEDDPEPELRTVQRLLHDELALERSDRDEGT